MRDFFCVVFNETAALIVSIGYGFECSLSLSASIMTQHRDLCRLSLDSVLLSHYCQWRWLIVFGYQLSFVCPSFAHVCQARSRLMVPKGGLSSRLLGLTWVLPWRKNFGNIFGSTCLVTENFFDYCLHRQIRDIRMSFSTQLLLYLHVWWSRVPRTAFIEAIFRFLLVIYNFQNTSLHNLCSAFEISDCPCSLRR